MKRFVLWPVLCCLILALTNCGERKPDKDEEEPPPPPTAQEVAAQLRNAWQPANQAQNQGELITDQLHQQVVQNVRAAKNQHMNPETSPNGAQGIAQAASEAESQVYSAFDAKDWRACLLFADVYDVLNPGSSKFDRIRTEADLYAKIPQVSIKSFFKDMNSGETHVSLRVTLHTGQVEEVWVREGDEFHDLRFDQIIGQNRGIRLEYMPLDETVDVMRK